MKNYSDAINSAYYASENGNKMLIDKVKKLARRPTERLREGRIRKHLEADLLQDIQLMTEVITRLYIRLREVEKTLQAMTEGEFKPLTPEVIDVENEFIKELLSQLISGWISDNDSPELSEMHSLDTSQTDIDSESDTP